MDLAVPHFHHEIVYEAIQIVFESGAEKLMVLIVNLLKHFFDCGMISTDQMNTVYFLLSIVIAYLKIGIKKDWQKLLALKRFSQLHRELCDKFKCYSIIGHLSYNI